MAELITKRVARLKTRKQELVGKIRELGANQGRNAGHKVAMLETQVERVSAKIKELKGVKQ